MSLSIFLPWLGGKKVLKMKTFPGQIILFSVREIKEKDDNKSQRKVKEFKNLKKNNLIVNRFLKSMISIDCKVVVKNIMFLV